MLASRTGPQRPPTSSLSGDEVIRLSPTRRLNLVSTACPGVSSTRPIRHDARRLDLRRPVLDLAGDQDRVAVRRGLGGAVRAVVPPAPPMFSIGSAWPSVWRRGLKDVSDQALMRGLDTAVPSARPGAFPILLRASAGAGHKPSDGNFPAVAPPPPMRELEERSAGDQLILANPMAIDCAVGSNLRASSSGVRPDRANSTNCRRNAGG